MYIYIVINDIYIVKPSGNIPLKLPWQLYINIGTLIKWYITVIYFHVSVCFPLAVVSCELYYTNLNFPLIVFIIYQAVFLTCQTHLVTHPQSIITSPVGNHRIYAISKLSILFHPCGNMKVLIGLKIISGSVPGVTSYLRVSMPPNI